MRWSSRPAAPPSIAKAVRMIARTVRTWGGTRHIPSCEMDDAAACGAVVLQYDMVIWGSLEGISRALAHPSEEGALVGKGGGEAAHLGHAV